ncbi:MAG: hypothetical protein SVM80_12430 [Halobacteriota archaeon]|nr:hypothetical protein [Halobacteriota archaeon]
MCICTINGGSDLGIGDHTFRFEANDGNLDAVGDIGGHQLPSVKAPPTASFNYTPLNPVVDEEVSFDASTSYDPDGTIINFTHGTLAMET